MLLSTLQQILLIWNLVQLYSISDLPYKIKSFFQKQTKQKLHIISISLLREDLYASSTFYTTEWFREISLRWSKEIYLFWNDNTNYIYWKNVFKQHSQVRNSLRERQNRTISFSIKIFFQNNSWDASTIASKIRQKKGLISNLWVSCIIKSKIGFAALMDLQILWQ